MSLEDQIENLIGSIDNLSESLEELHALILMQQGVEAGELEMEGPRLVREAESKEYTTPSDDPEWPNVDIDGEPTGTNDKTLELITLAKELGFNYLLEGDQLVVDQRVLNEYQSRRLGNKAT